jgi:PhnB protein
MSAKSIPDNYPIITPYLIIDGASAAIDFYRQVFGATERMRMAMPGGRIGHAELMFGTSLVMLADEFPDMDIRGPRKFGGSPVTIHLYVEDVDAIFARALAAGAKEQRAVATQFYGDRSGTLVDPWGHVWSVATHVEDVAPDELQRRMGARQGQS